MWTSWKQEECDMSRSKVKPAMFTFSFRERTHTAYVRMTESPGETHFVCSLCVNLLLILRYFSRNFFLVFKKKCRKCCSRFLPAVVCSDKVSLAFVHGAVIYRCWHEESDCSSFYFFEFALGESSNDKMSEDFRQYFHCFLADFFQIFLSNRFRNILV